MTIKVSEEVVTNPTLNEDGTYTVTEENLDAMVKSFRTFLQNKKYRNLPTKNPKSTEMIEVTFAAAQYVKQILVITTGLIEAKVIESDKFKFLSAKVDTFNKWDTIINNDWIPQAKKAIADEEAKIAESANAKEDILSSPEVANMASEPTGKDDEVIDVVTNKHQHWIVDKVNFTITFTLKGSKRVIKIVPQGSWRSTILKYLLKLISWIKNKYKDFSDRCIGIKQVVQFKIAMMKFKKRQAKADAEAAANKAANEKQKAQMEEALKVSDGILV